MAQLCSVCRHPLLADVDADIVIGTPTRAIAARFNVSRSAVSRHARNCLKPRLEAEHIRADGPVVCTPRNGDDSLAAFFEGHRVATASPVSTLRDLLLADLRRLDLLMSQAVQANSGAAVLAVIRARWNVIDRSGLAALPDKALADAGGTEDQTSRGKILASMGRQAAFANLVGMFFDKLSDISPGDLAETREQKRKALAASLSAPSDSESESNPL